MIPIDRIDHRASAMNGLHEVARQNRKLPFQWYALTMVLAALVHAVLSINEHRRPQ